MTNHIELFHWQNPKPHEVAPSVDGFLMQLQQPTLIELSGEDNSRCRLFVTLLHGNEPSGLKAVHQWLKLGRQPKVSLYIFIGAVEAATEAPHFSHRHLPHLRDLNRCFYGPFDDVPGRIAAILLETIEQLKPEATLDVHNTSGSGPSFAVSFCSSPNHIALTSLFTERLLLTETKLGALMEFTTEEQPIVTIECGGANDPESDNVAWDGLQRFAELSQVLEEPAHDWNLDVLTKPIRITLSTDTEIAYAETPCPEADITVRPDVENFNFGRIQAGTVLAQLKVAGLNCIHATDSNDEDRTDDILEVRGHELVSRVGLKCFMITMNPAIAKSDCLCYAVIDEPVE